MKDHEKVKLIDENIQSVKNNVTRFVVIGGKENISKTSSDKTSIVISINQDSPGSLFKSLEPLAIKNSNIPIISNYDSKINSNTDSIIYALKNQMANIVRWTESIKKLEETNSTKIIEIGPGKVLSGLIARISKKFDIKSIDKIEDLKKFD